MSGKEHDDGLDASFIISQAKSRNRPLHPYTPEKEEEASALSEPSGEAASSSATKEEGRRRRGKGQDYERLFIRNAPSNTRPVASLLSVPRSPCSRQAKRDSI